MAGKRHSPDEIVGKLREADEMMEKGRRQGDIARALGISVMTYHRWRKARPRLGDGSRDGSRTVPSRPPVRPILEHTHQIVRLDELRLENDRLRRLVADLMLEIVRLEESQQGRGALGTNGQKGLG
jgi:putative transposase